MHLNEIKPTHILAVLRKIEGRKATSIAEKCRCWLNEMFSLAVAEGHIEMNPAAEMKKAAKAKPPAISNPYLTMEQLPEFLRTLHYSSCEYQTKLAIKLLFLTGVRLGELRHTHLSFLTLKTNYGEFRLIM